ncbi:hypothetical protein BDY19DRAFT_990629 [Irpex rosettiformis]|uniref:Uncharacterized protein n=1 Tax=Irpex rosettiformis TaxID=378272 RepID=A0ACB8UC60_9APHY|nr:hypothetical protein BDY19DRAFT_990629 [Irpex rosettiformis]
MVVKLDSSTNSGQAIDEVEPIVSKSRKSRKVCTGDAEAVAKKEKKKRKKIEEAEAEHKGEHGEDEVQQGRPKKRKKNKDIAAAESESVEEDTKEHKKKERPEPAKESADPTTTPELADPQASKKRHKKSNYSDHVLTTATVEREKEPKKKKNRKHSGHGFKDPSTDESLSEQASRALSYAYTQAHNPTNWKFNKARQNWLIRNVLSEETIPDDYVPLANRYMSGVQGGARDALIKSCRDAALEQSEESKADKPDVPSNDAPLEKKQRAADMAKASFQSTTREQRARDLLELLTQCTSHDSK